MNDTAAILQAKFGDIIRKEIFRDNVRLVVPPDAAHAVLAFLKAEHGYDMLADIAGVDYLGYPEAADRFGVIYAITNTATGARLFIKTFVNDPEPDLKSVTDLWAGADWLEREIYDLLGIRFHGHPDLRRILMPEGCESHPLRKDYPLRGHGERHNFPNLTRAEG
jgi:NADH-quinone oxidoreductase subunit C